eukprot:ctg_2116.g732
MGRRGGSVDDIRWPPRTPPESHSPTPRRVAVVACGRTWFVVVPSEGVESDAGGDADTAHGTLEQASGAAFASAVAATAHSAWPRPRRGCCAGACDGGGSADDGERRAGIDAHGDASYRGEGDGAHRLPDGGYPGGSDDDQVLAVTDDIEAGEERGVALQRNRSSCSRCAGLRKRIPGAVAAVAAAAAAGDALDTTDTGLAAHIDRMDTLVGGGCGCGGRGRGRVRML